MNLNARETQKLEDRKGVEERVKGTESTIWVEGLESRYCYKRRRK